MEAVGATIGVEEEYHLVNAETFQLADAPQVADRAIEVLGDVVQRDISTSEVEVATPVLASLGDVRTSLSRLHEVARRHSSAVALADNG